MKLIVIGNELAPSKEIEFPDYWIKIVIGLFSFFLISFALLLGFYIDKNAKLDRLSVELSRLQADVFYDHSLVNDHLSYSTTLFAEQSKQTGFLEAKLTRLEVLGQKLAEGAGMTEEFDFTQLPGVGGQMMSEESDIAFAHSAPLQMRYERLSDRLNVRQKELSALASLIEGGQFVKERYLAGKPIISGWLSSNYGLRTDPFHGKQAFHHGLDFAGKEGADVISVASGVVVWSGNRYGFGTMVEIDHANGYVTRYAHNKKNLVQVGDVVKKGQVIAFMGSTGRSTGPHVHFEVLKEGRHVDPKRYIYRKAI